MAVLARSWNIVLFRRNYILSFDTHLVGWPFNSFRRNAIGKGSGCFLFVFRTKWTSLTASKAPGRWLIFSNLMFWRVNVGGGLAKVPSFTWVLSFWGANFERWVLLLLCIRIRIVLARAWLWQPFFYFKQLVCPCSHSSLWPSSSDNIFCFISTRSRLFFPNFF